MVMTWIWTALLGISIFCAWLTGSGTQLTSACLQGAQAGVSLGISVAGSLCLWSGVGALMSKNGMTEALSRLLKPLLGKIFPSSRKDPVLSQALSANVCANLLGLGNAATPMGIQAAKRLNRDGTATDELCRLIVLNTASIQLIPSTVAAIRASLGACAPFDILPAVWITSACSAGLGVAMAYLLGRFRKP